MTIAHVVGARPNFMKVAPVFHGLATRGVSQVMLHTGQHFDSVMSKDVLADLSLPEPDFYLGIHDGTRTGRMAKTLAALEGPLLHVEPSAVVVYGDVDSTLAGALCATNLALKVCHVEAGLRSGDREMPEEINRIVTDHIASALFAPSEDAVSNLLNEGVPQERIHLVGNVMIDSLLACLPKARKRESWRDLGVDRHGYLLVTLHRPSNVDSPSTLHRLLSAICEAADGRPVLFTVHPRTRQQLSAVALPPSVKMFGAVRYLDFLSLLLNAGAMLTDSGGVQEEASFLGVPCVTLRRTTERPVTVTHGTNRLVSPDSDQLAEAILSAMDAASSGQPRLPSSWDGQAGERVASILANGTY